MQKPHKPNDLFWITAFVYLGIFLGRIVLWPVNLILDGYEWLKLRRGRG